MGNDDKARSLQASAKLHSGFMDEGQKVTADALEHVIVRTHSLLCAI